VARVFVLLATGLPIDVHAYEPDTIYVVPTNSDSKYSRSRAADNTA